jgi:hypothetical protein
MVAICCLMITSFAGIIISIIGIGIHGTRLMMQGITVHTRCVSSKWAFHLQQNKGKGKSPNNILFLVQLLNDSCLPIVGRRVYWLGGEGLLVDCLEFVQYNSLVVCSTSFASFLAALSVVYSWWETSNVVIDVYEWIKSSCFVMRWGRS